MIDTHCHVDAYPNPYDMVLAVERARILTIAVTNLPSAFERAYPHVQGFRSVRLAVGLHPLVAAAHAVERQKFARCLEQTSYVGEVGLDFSVDGRSSRDVQIESFRFVLELVRERPKFVSIHSRRAESAVLDLLDEVGVRPVVFHWYSGPLGQLDRLLAQGHFCSINPAMTRSRSGKAIIERLPIDRVLTETDGPFVKVAGRPAQPRDVSLVEAFLSQLWERDCDDVQLQVKRNLRAAIPVV